MEKYFVKFKEGTSEESLSEIKEKLDVTYVDQMMNCFFVNISDVSQLDYLESFDFIVYHRQSRVFKLLNE